MVVFISYAHEDLSSFKIPEIADYLEQQPDIEKVYYWERDNDSSQNIIEYMEQSILNSDIILAISSPYALSSTPVNSEIDFALLKEKSIIPIFKTIEDVRDFIQMRRGVQFNMNDFNGFLEELYSIIKGNNSSMARSMREKKRIKNEFNKLKKMVIKLFNLEVDFAYKFTRNLLKSDNMQKFFGIEVKNKDNLTDQFIGFLDGLYWIIPNSRTLRFRNKMNNTILTRNTLINMTKDEVISKLNPFIKDITKYIKDEFNIKLEE